MKNTFKSSKGITLVALVITIIILLILAGISISALTNTGIFGKAKDAKQKSDEAALDQNTKLDEYESEINAYLPGQNNGGGGETVVKVTLVDGSTVNLTKENFGEYLGKKVTNYKIIDGTETVTVGSKSYEVSTTYRLYYIDFDNKFGDGAGTVYLKADQGSSNYILQTDGNEETSKIKNLNPSLYAEGVTSPTSTNNNMKAVTWLTDTAKWEGLKTSGASTELGSSVNYVVGAPSLEMMMDSYNEYYKLTGDIPDYTDIPAAPDTTRKKLFYKYESGATGYHVGPNADNDVEYYRYTSDNSVKTDSEIDTMYYPGDGKYYWLASPSALASDCVMYVSVSSESVRSNNYNANAGFCPLVSLKSSVNLKLAD